MNRHERRAQAAILRKLRKRGLPPGTDWVVIRRGDGDVDFFTRDRGLISSKAWMEELDRRVGPSARRKDDT